MSRTRIAVGSALASMLGIVGVLLSIFSLNRYASIGDTLVVIEQHPLYNLSLALIVGGLIGLAACGVWYLYAARRSRQPSAAALVIPERALALLKQGNSREAVEGILLGEGHPRPAVQEALELDWPFGGGPKCPRCGGELRAFSVLNHQLGAKWYHCPGCQWVGEVEPEAADSHPGSADPSHVGDGTEPRNTGR